ncbi:MAG: 6-phosphogluconolactonase, partial [Acidimicrobiia bacterium]
MIYEQLPNSNDVARRAAVLMADRMWAAVARRGSAALAVSGGRTPSEMFRVLAALPVPWAHVHLFQV